MPDLSDFNDLDRVAGSGAVVTSIDSAIAKHQALVEKPARRDSASPDPQPTKSEGEWPDPMIPGARSTPEIPASLLPSWVGDMAEAVAASTQTPPAMAVMLALSVLATVMQRRWSVQPYGEFTSYTEPLSLWTLTAMPSGARKTAVINALTDPLMIWEKRERDAMRREIAKVNEARAAAKNRIDKLIRSTSSDDDDEARQRISLAIERERDNTPDEIFTPKLFTGDTTAETLQSLLVKQSERMAVLTDEGGIFLVMAGLYSGGNASLDVFLQAHAGSPVRVDRADREAYLEHPALSFGLALQPGILADVASGRRFRDSGLLARFLYCMPVSNVGKRDVRRHVSIPKEVRLAYEAGLFELLDKRPRVSGDPKLLPFSDPARECWLCFGEEIEHQQGEGGKYESISDWTSKLPGAAARMAGLIELAEIGSGADTISEDAAARAVALARALIPHAQEAFGLLGTDAADGDALAMLKWIRAEGGALFKRSTCQKAMEGRFRSVSRLTAAAARLVQRDVLKEDKRGNPGAPPSVWYRVNPKVFVD